MSTTKFEGAPVVRYPNDIPEGAGPLRQLVAEIVAVSGLILGYAAMTAISWWAFEIEVKIGDFEINGLLVLISLVFAVLLITAGISEMREENKYRHGDFSWR